jgi:EAL domain-containing protein (putative c-di-GMP-specific phosphodiesterase class I)
MLDDLSEHPQEAAAQTEIVGEKVLTTLNQPYQLGGFEHTSTPSIGVTLFVEHEGTIDDLLKRADLAMYQAKAAGRNTLRFFDPAMQAVVTQRAELEAGLREALLKDQFLLHYQSQVDATGRITGAEVLLRWRHPEQGLMSPAGFIPFAEESGLIVPMGQWVLQTACAQLAQWATRPELARLSIAVNISARQIKLPNFIAEVMAVIDQSGANPNLLKLELTESLILDDVEDVIAKMAKLKGHGVRFSLDDFGTGYSSLAYLKRLPLNQLKIDQSFVRDILVDPNDAAIAKMVIALAEALDLSVIAEGVETIEQRDFLASQGCYAYQGYLYGRPLPIADFEATVPAM